MTSEPETELPAVGKAIVFVSLAIGMAGGWYLNLVSPVYGVLPGMLFSIVGGLLCGTIGVKVARRLSA